MKRKRFNSMWLALLLLCLAIPLHAQTVQIEGYQPIGSSYNNPLFEISSSSITVSSSYGKFDYVYVDGTEIAHKSSSYWYSCTVNVTPYLDGQLHTLQLKCGSTNYGICYFTSDLSTLIAAGEELLYTVSNGEAKVVAAKIDVTSVEIPSTYEANGESYPITSIGKNAFRNIASLTSVTIPESVTSIGGSAFSGCESLTSLTFNATDCTTCGSSGSPAFPSTISSLTFGSNVTKIPSYFLYHGSQIESMELPAALTSIGDNAFYRSASLTSVVIPKNVTSVGYGAFGGCSSLQKSAYPSGLSNPFSYGLRIAYPRDCTIDDDKVIYNADKTMVYFAPMTLPESYEIPEAITSIGEYAYYLCSSLTSVTIPESVTSIGNRAFSGCESLSSLAFNATDCTTCGSDGSPAFPSSISSLTFGSNVTKIPSYLLYNGSQIESMELPAALTSIGDYAFRNSASLSSLTIPETVTSIGAYAFYGCSSVSSLTIPGTVTSIEAYAFYGCSSVSSLTIPETVTSIGAYAFYGCSSVSSLTIPEAVTSIGGSAFVGCESLTSLTFNAIDCTTSGSDISSIFPSSVSSLIFGSKVTKIPSYLLAGGSGVEQVTIPNSVTSIGSRSFYNCNFLKSITFGSGLLSIGSDAFSYEDYRNSSRKISIAKVFWLGNTPPNNYDAVDARVNYVANDQYSCSNQKKYQFLSSKFSVDGTVYVPVSPSERTCDVVDCIYTGDNPAVVIADKVMNRGIEMTVKEVNQYAFYDNNYIESVQISNDGSVGEYAFYDCEELKDIKAANQGMIGKLAFSGCGKLQTAKIENKGKLDSYAFGSCHSLQTVEISNNGNIEEHAFSDCRSLQTATISNNGSVGSNAFTSCTSLQTIDISNNGGIGNYAFSASSSSDKACTSLVSAKIHNNGIIGNNAFSGCIALSEVDLGERVKGIGEYAFYDCSSIPAIVIPDSVASVGRYAFAGCSAMSSVTIGKGVPSLPERVFSGCRSLASLIIPNNVMSIADYAFFGCSSLADLTFEDAVDDENAIATEDRITLGSNGGSPLFADCPLDEVYIGRKLSYETSSGKGYSPFYRNTSLRSVEITDAETEIYDNEFYGCTNLKSLKIGNGVTKIGNWAFSGCSSLDYFSAGYHVETIGQEAFSDCTGLTNYYSFSIVPPVCGSQALDDINKWECTLFVPAESSDEYMAADQWKDFFFVNETDAVLIEEIRLNSEEIAAMTEETFQLEAEILPANATKKRLEWTSSDPAVVTVDEAGLATFVGHGNAVITASATDGSGVTASVTVAVSIKQPDLGDSNANGVINIADAVNTANYAIGNEVEHISLEAADVNQDGNVTLADASATVTLILNQPVAPAEPAKVRALDTDAADLLIIEKSEDHAADREDLISFDVRLDSMREFVAMQAEISVPAGMALESVTCGGAAAGHALATRRMDERTMRVILFDPDNTAFLTGGEALLQLEIRTVADASGDIEIRNIVASDAQAHEYRLAAIGADGNISTGISVSAETEVEVMTAPGVIAVCNAKGEQIAVYTAEGASITRLIADEDTEHIDVAPGVYVVVAGTERIKVIVK